MKIMHANGFTPEEKLEFRTTLRKNIRESMLILVNQSEALGFLIGAESSDIVFQLKNHSLPLTHFLNRASAQAIAALWKDPAIQQTYARKSEYQLAPAVEYLMQHVERLLSEECVLTDEDALMARERTTGFSELQFRTGGTNFRMVDVGGQRGERKKWLSLFTDVNAIMYVVALSEYDEKLFEDEKVNRMRESLALFKSICENPFFSKDTAPCTIILFLNKSDLFREKLKTVPLSKYFTSFKGGEDFDQGCKFFRKRFEDANPMKNRHILPHIVCATDTNNVKIVFESVRASLLSRNLEAFEPTVE